MAGTCEPIADSAVVGSIIVLKFEAMNRKPIPLGYRCETKFSGHMGVLPVGEKLCESKT